MTHSLLIDMVYVQLEIERNENGKVKGTNMVELGKSPIELWKVLLAICL